MRCMYQARATDTSGMIVSSMLMSNVQSGHSIVIGIILIVINFFIISNIIQYTSVLSHHRLSYQVIISSTTNLKKATPLIIS